MTLEELNRYRKLIHEISALEQTIDELETPLFSHGDKDGASKPSGVSDPTKAAAFKLAQCRQRLEAMKAERAEELMKIVAWLETVEEPDVSAITMKRFVLGLSWREVTRSVYGSKAEESLAKRKLYRYLKLVPNVPE